MAKKGKCAQSFLICFALILSLLFALALTASAAETVDEGTCGIEGDNLTWMLDVEGTLTISGTGAMRNYTNYQVSFNYPGWHKYRGQIKKVVIEPGVTTVGSYAFGTNLQDSQVEKYAIEVAEIPNSVTYIGSYAFSYCTKLQRIAIPSSVTRIGSFAFNICSGLTMVDMGDQVTEIGEEAFYGCISLPSIELSPSLTKLGDRAFWYCTGLTTVKLPKALAELGENPFMSCIALREYHIDPENPFFMTDGHVVFSKDGSELCFGCGVMDDAYRIPDGVLHIRNNAFAYSQISGCQLPDGLLTIGKDAFSDSTIKEITLPDSVIYAGFGAFARCSNLKQAHLGGGLPEISDWMFIECSSLQEIDIPDSVTRIGEKAFYWCTALRRVGFGDGVKEIGDYAFLNCDGMRRFDFPKSLKRIGYEVFASSDNIEAYTVDPDNPYFRSVDGVLFTRDMTELIQAPSHFTGPYVVPDGVKKLRDYCFAGCANLTDLVLGDQVREIGSHACFACLSLNRLYLPESVYEIGEQAFSFCSRLNTIVIVFDPRDAEIGRAAFYSCGHLDIYFSGSSDDWRWVGINMKSQNEALDNATVHYECETPYFAGGRLGTDGQAFWVYTCDSPAAGHSLSFGGVAADGERLFCAAFTSDGRFLSVAEIAEPGTVVLEAETERVGFYTLGTDLTPLTAKETLVIWRD